MSSKVARKLDVGPGDRLFFAGDPRGYPISGVIGDEVQPSLDVRVLGFVARPLNDLRRTLQYMSQEPSLAAKTVYVRTGRKDDVSGVAREIRRLSPPHTVVETADSIASSSKLQADTIRQAIVALGLLSLLITGIGLAFVARVWSRRRLREMTILILNPPRRSSSSWRASAPNGK